MDHNACDDSQTEIYDIAVVDGGINGGCLARDAAGRDLRVLLCERNDLASHTSSASSKLIHGGLRYLEHYEFRLVAKALAEREVLLRNASHIVRPFRFVRPHVEGLRPRWMMRSASSSTIISISSDARSCPAPAGSISTPTPPVRTYAMATSTPTPGPSRRADRPRRGRTRRHRAHPHPLH